MRLALPDVDLPEAVLTIRATKFYKSRLVPIGPHLAAVLKAYMPLRQRGSPPQGDRSFPTGRRRGGSANMPCFCSSTIPGRASPKRSS
jgi:integrase